jgi:hypothetical protein
MNPFHKVRVTHVSLAVIISEIAGKEPENPGDTIRLAEIAVRMAGIARRYRSG